MSTRSRKTTAGARSRGAGDSARKGAGRGVTRNLGASSSSEVGGGGVGPSASFHIGIISEEEVTVSPGVALEQPLHPIRTKRRRGWQQPCNSKQVEMTKTSPSTAHKSPAKTLKRKRKLQHKVMEEIDNFGSDSDTEDDDGEDYLLDVMPIRPTIDMLCVAEEFSSETQIEDTTVEWSLIEPSAPESSEPNGSTSQKAVTGPTYGPNISDFLWEILPQPPIDPVSRREKFSAPTGPVGSFNDPYEIFIKYWDYSIMQMIAVETNRYAEQCLLKKMNLGTLDGSSRILAWKDTDVDELYVFFAIILATGVVIKSDLTEYWSVPNEVFDTPYFGEHMSYNRFIALSAMLHFMNNDQVDVSTLSLSEMKICKIAPIVNHLNDKFEAIYQMGQCVSLDESLTQWKGCLSISQLIKTKAATRGVKTYEVCDSGSGYLWRFKIYAGREDGDNEYGYITSLVLQLLQGLENKGHTIFMDNFYNSPMLARILKSKGFDCVGTVRLNRQYVPTQFKSLVKADLLPGSVHGCTSGDVDLLVWKDRNLVSLISTYHGASSVTRGGKTRPAVVHDYNVRMGGVDKKDQMLASYPLERKRTSVWYKKVFRRLLNVSVLNSYIVHKESPPTSGRPHPQKYTHRQFRRALVKSILAKHSKQRILQPKTSLGRVFFSEVMMRHIPKEKPLVEGSNHKQRGRCVICRKRISMTCPGCNVALCLNECFAKYHQSSK